MGPVSPHAWGRKAPFRVRERHSERFPHMRGDGRSLRDARCQGHAGFPTCVGTEGFAQTKTPAQGRFPHMRGDGRSSQGR